MGSVLVKTVHISTDDTGFTVDCHQGQLVAMKQQQPARPDYRHSLKLLAVFRLI